MNTKMQKKEITVSDAVAYSKMIAEEFGEDHADLLVCFDGEKVHQALFGLFSTTHRADQPIKYPDLAHGFLRLLDAKVLVPDFPIKGVAEEQLQAMRNRFGVPSTKVASTATEKTNTNPDDYSKITRAEFDIMPTDDLRRLYKSNASLRNRADYFWGGGK